MSVDNNGCHTLFFSLLANFVFHSWVKTAINNNSIFFVVASNFFRSNLGVLPSFVYDIMIVQDFYNSTQSEFCVVQILFGLRYNKDIK